MRLFPQRGARSCPTIHLANEGGALPDFSLVGFGNAVPLADGWTLIPYGEWIHEKGIQRFGKEQAQKIVSGFKSLANRFARAVIGLPVYNGHPDIADTYRPLIARETNSVRRMQLEREMRAFANDYPDKKEYGQIADLEAREEGLAIKQVLSNAGAALAEQQGKKFISPHWSARQIGDLNGKPVYAPEELLSVGLTDHPNIPNRSLINTAPIAKTQIMKREQLIALLVTLANVKAESIGADVTDEQLVDRVNTAASSAKLALANETAAKTTAENRANNLNTDLATVKGQLETANTTIANERKAKAENLVNEAVKLGKIPESEKSTWTTLANTDYAVAERTLGTMQKLKVKPTVEQQRLAEADQKLKQGLGNEMGDAPTASISDLVNEEKQKLGHIKNASERHNMAFANVARRHPKLFVPTTADAS